MNNKQTIQYRDCTVTFGTVEGGYNYLIEFPSGGMASYGAETLDEMWKRVDASIENENLRMKMDYIIDTTNGNYPRD